MRTPPPSDATPEHVDSGERLVQVAGNPLAARMVARFLSRFRRITTSGAYVPQVDGIRAIAIGSVFLFHLTGDIFRHSTPAYHEQWANSPLVNFSKNLSFGVQLFFVLSGFILALPFAQHYLRDAARVPLRKYLKRRLTRLEPPYIAALLGLFALKVVGDRGTVAELAPHLGASLVYVHNMVFGTPSDINFVAWSLEIEIQFYLLAPGLAWLLFRADNQTVRRGVILTVCVVLAFIAAALPQQGRWPLSIVGQGSFFLAGFLLADWYCTRDSRAVPRGGWDLVTIAALLVTLVARDAGGLLWPLSALAIVVAYQGVFAGKWIGRLLSWTPIAVLGGMCYSIYLLHNYIIAACGMFTERLGATWPFPARLLLQFVLMSPVVVGISALFYLLIERPCMDPRWPERLRERLRTSLAARSAAQMAPARVDQDNPSP